MTNAVALVAAQVVPVPRPAAATDSSASAAFTLDIADSGDAAGPAMSSGKASISKPVPAASATGKDALAKGASGAKPVDGGLMAWLLSVLAPAPAETPAASGDAAESAAAPSLSGAQSDAANSPKAAGKGAPAAAAPAQTSRDLSADPAVLLPAASAGPRSGADAADDDVQPDAPTTPAVALKELTHSAASQQLQMAASNLPPAPDPAAAGSAAGTSSFERTLAASFADPGSSGSPAAPHVVQSPDHPEWPLALADQVQWQLGHEVQEARLELHPRDLGSVQVQVRITSEGAEVRFAATHPQAREALAAAMPQLRALLVGDGLLTTQTHVGSQSSWQSSNQAPHSPQVPPGAGGAAADEEEATAMTRVVRVGLIDDFA